MSENLYVYGIIEQEDLAFDIEGVAGGDRIYTVDYRSLSAVVSDIDTTDPERTDERVRTHQDVLQTVIEYDGGRTVVPMQYGMAFKDARTLKGVLRGSRRAFRKALNDIDGTVELGVKLVSTGDLNHGTVRESVTDQLSGLAINETDDDLFSDRLVVNRSYLVDRADRDAFDAAIDAIEADYGDDATVQYTGPWPPYNFVDIHIGAEGR